MVKRIVAFGAMAAIVVAAVVSALAVLDIITMADLKSALGRTILVIAIVTTAIVLLFGASKATVPPQHGSQPPKP
jgi:uncharacterized RDD family membrane protein YckC